MHKTFNLKTVRNLIANTVIVEKLQKFFEQDEAAYRMIMFAEKDSEYDVVAALKRIWFTRGFNNLRLDYAYHKFHSANLEISVQGDSVQVEAREQNGLYHVTYNGYVELSDIEDDDMTITIYLTGTRSLPFGFRKQTVNCTLELTRLV